MWQRLAQLLILITLSAGLSACIYKIDVQQGNIITDAGLSQIHVGMTALQVEQVLGEPLLDNLYADGRLIYVYTNKKGHQAMKHRRLIIQFLNGRVYHYDVTGNISTLSAS